MKRLTNNLTKTLAAVLIALVLVPGSNIYASQLPDLGSEYRETISVDEEKFIGDTWMSQIRGTGMVCKDPLVNEYVRFIGNKLTPFVEMPYSDIKIRFFVIHEHTVNAFAFFGGHVAIHTGLILTTESESELAGVMSHELGHVSQQHILRQITEQKRLMPITLAGTIAAAVLGLPDLAIPILASHGQHMLNFSRQHEQEADRIGMQILAKANFDPEGLPNIFERMSHSSRYDTRPPEYLLTHPLYESRISDTRARATSFVYKQKSTSNMFHLIRARLEVQSTDNILKLISTYEQKLKSKRVKNELATRYAYAYALLEAGKPQEASIAIEKLDKEYPDDLIIQLTAASIERDKHDHAAAQRRLEKMLRLYPDSPSVLLQYTDLLLETNQPKLAKKFLQQYKNLHPLEPVYYELARHAEGMLGNQIGVFEANAEWYRLNGDVESAIKQLSMAIDLKTADPTTRNRLENRLVAMEALLKKQKTI